MRLIALFGPKRCGKDTAATMLLDAWHALAENNVEVRDLRLARRSDGEDPNAWTVAFADPIRFAAVAIGLPERAVYDDKDRPCPELGGMWTGRDLLVALGEATRSLAPDYFARHTIERARDLGGLVIITDGRRCNEARVVREAGGVCAWVHQPEAHARRHEDVVLEPEVHGLCDFEIDNSGDLEHLRDQSSRLLDFALQRPEVTT